MKIFLSPDDEELYDFAISLLREIKLTQGGTALSSTLRRHSDLKNFLIDRQKLKIKQFEEKYSSLQKH